ncbi:MAG TPA: hypothetical protein VNW99_01980 [Cytophagaceae bacterium]|nr:hypothetical protein [Cytophagaceae bacterium]
MLTISACQKVPEYPVTPQIEFAKISRYVVSNPFSSVPIDSIIITVNFKDGNGDLGLLPNLPPFTAFDVMHDSLGNFIRYNHIIPFSCDSFNIDYYDTDNLVDTVKGIRNIDYYNYFLELKIKTDSTHYRSFNFPFCSNINGRFPQLSPDRYNGPLEGNLSFTINNTKVLRDSLNNKTVKFRVQIEDRAFHKSNVVESPDVLFTY